MWIWGEFSGRFPSRTRPRIYRSLEIAYPGKLHIRVDTCGRRTRALGKFASEFLTITGHHQQNNLSSYMPSNSRTHMAQRCVHNGCGKSFTDAEEECAYHPGPPIFHEGQKGVWTPSQWPI